MLELNPKVKPNGNESEEHFLLKNIAVSYLKDNYSCKYVADEVRLGYTYGRSLENSHYNKTWKQRKVSDVVGIQRRKKNGKHEHIVRNIEVKVSKMDLKRGFNVGGDYNYIMAPRGIVNPKHLFPFVGLIEVNLKKLKWDKGFRTNIEGVFLTKPPKRINESKQNREKWIQKLKDQMLKDYTNQHAYRGKWFYPGFSYKR